MATEDTRFPTISLKPSMYPHEIEFLHTLFTSSDKFVYYEETPRRTSIQREIENPETLRVALLAFKMPSPRPHVQQGEEKPLEHAFSKEAYKYVEYPETNGLLSPDNIVDAIEECLKAHNSEGKPIHFLLLNELAISYKNHDELLSRIMRKMTDMRLKTAIGIMGSFHCDRTFLNLSPVVSPFLEAGKHEYKVVAHVAKQSPAAVQRENIRTPDGTCLGRFSTPYGDLVVWICLDMYDPNLVLTLFRTNNRLSHARKSTSDGNNPYGQPVVDMLFVPSYNRDEQENVHDIARMISRYARSTVFVCNDSTHCPDGPGWNENICYHLGEPISPGRGGKEERERWSWSLFEIAGWRKRQEEMSRPFIEEYSSIFGHILGIHASSFVEF